MMERRILGQTGERLSVIGFGGIVVAGATPAEASQYVGRAIDRDINYFDVAPSYGNAEERLGPALKPFRDNVFLACKTAQRTAVEAEQELHSSLKRLQTDHVDLYQLHGVASLEHAEKVLAPGGALETLVAARERGLIRHIGFSAHSEAAALRLLEAFPFASVLLPVNLFCWRDGRFPHRVCEKAPAKGTGILALKTLARRPWKEGEREKKWPKCWYAPIDTIEDARIAISFTLSRPVTAAVCPSHADLLWLMCDALESLVDHPVEAPLEAGIEGKPIFETDLQSE